MTSLAQAFPAEQSRCRELLGTYKLIGSQGAFGALVLEDVLRRADAAASSGDIVEMLRIHEEMRGLK